MKTPLSQRSFDFPQSSEADSDKQDDDQQAGDGEPEAPHGSIPGGVESTVFGDGKRVSA